jgi:purine-cytosine permease-like protein
MGSEDRGGRAIMADIGEVRQRQVAGTAIELTGIEVIDERERTGVPRSLFWPWFAANISVLGVSYGAFTLGFGVSFWQAVIAGVIGVVVSFAFCGVIALAGKRGSAPTMVLSRAAFGVRGNRLTAVLSWLLTVGWETVLVVLATLAAATVFDRLGWGGGTGTKVVALIVVSAITVLAGVAGFALVMRLQAVITVITAVLTVVYMVLVAGDISWTAVSALPAGSAQQVIGALVFLMTGFGLGSAPRATTTVCCATTPRARGAWWRPSRRADTTGSSTSAAAPASSPRPWPSGSAPATRPASTRRRGCSTASGRSSAACSTST